jgi:hypothetical protein
MKVTGKKEPFLDFLRELVITMLKTHGKPPLATGPKKQCLVTERYDGLNHVLVSTEDNAKGKAMRRNCRQCHEEGKKERKSVTKCKKCDVGLHTFCFEEWLHYIFRAIFRVILREFFRAIFREFFWAIIRDIFRAFVFLWDEKVAMKIQ